MLKCESSEMSKPGSSMKNTSNMEHSEILEVFLMKLMTALKRKIYLMDESVNECAILRGSIQEMEQKLANKDATIQSLTQDLTYALDMLDAVEVENARLRRQCRDSGVLFGVLGIKP